MSLTVRRIEPGEGAQLRSARLRLIAEAPWRRALLEEERGRPEEAWAERAARGAAGQDFVTLVAEADGAWIGVVDAFAGGDAVELAGLWVDPSRRGRGVGRALVDAVCAWAARRGDTRVALWVLAENDAAMRLFAAACFEPMGATVPTSDGSRRQQRLARTVA